MRSISTDMPPAAFRHFTVSSQGGVAPDRSAGWGGSSGTALQLHSRGHDRGSKRCDEMARDEGDLRGSLTSLTTGERTLCLHRHNSIHEDDWRIGRESIAS